MGHGWLLASVAGIPAFILYAITGTALLCLFGAAYVNITRHREIALIRDGNAAASVAFGGSLIGFAIPLSRAIQQASSIPDLVIWALLALFVQVMVYFIVRMLILPDVSERIAAGNVSAGIILGASSVAGGLVNAASMTL